MGTSLKTIVLHGSPRKSGNSDTLAEYFLKGLGEAGDHQVEHFYTNEMNIRPCQGCLTCETAVGHRCAIVDDMESIYSAFTDADIVVWATPMYWGYMTAQLKTALDRMESLVMRDGFRGKTFVVLITYHYHCESTVAFFERVCPFFGVRLHVITCRTLDADTNRDIPISSLPEKLEQAYELGKALSKALY
jgi:multimeric flavodoxin WrbA